MITANLTPGQKIRFDFSCTQGGQVYAIDVVPDPTVPPNPSLTSSRSRASAPPPAPRSRPTTKLVRRMT